MKTGHKNIIGPQLRRLRAAAGLTLIDLALAVAKRGENLSASDIGKIEERKRRVIDREFICLAAALGVEVKCLFARRRK
jgi:transcriptional regulator with XRE-family HTH domain